MQTSGFSATLGCMNPIRVGLIGFEGVMALDLIGPADAFTCTFVEDRRGEVHAGYEVLILGLSGKEFVSEAGVVFRPHRALEDAPPLDTVIVPGGEGLRRPEQNDRVVAWLKNRFGRIRRIASVCTGIYGLAPTGLLDGRSVCTHWRFARDVAVRFPKLHVDPDALFRKDGPFYTSAGVTASIDLSLALIEEDYGPRVSLTVARELVVYLKRAGGQEQYSEPLQFQIQSADRFADLAAWMPAHLTADLSVPALAERTCLSPRQFNRRFNATFGMTPAAYVRRLRLDEARRRLALQGSTVDQVSHSVGFSGPDAFTRAFEQHFGVAPSNYQRRFAIASASRSRGLRR